MWATSYDIVGRQTANLLAGVDDFTLGDGKETAAREILDNPNITLYTLDVENRRAIFVETGTGVDLNQAAFYYLTQLEEAVRVLTISFETMVALAEEVELDGGKLVFIYSVGRAGSTLASQLFAQVPGVVNLSEPDALTVLVPARDYEEDNKADLLPILDACVRLLCKIPAETAWVIKGRSFFIHLGDWLNELYPGSRNVFLYRQAERWLLSAYRAFYDGVERTDSEMKAMDNQYRKLLSPLVPTLAAYDPERHVTAVGLLCLLWLDVMGCYETLSAGGVEMMAIRYQDWKDRPRETARAMLEYTNCLRLNEGVMESVLATDSQAGTPLSREAIELRKSDLSKADMTAMAGYLREHAFIKTADFEAANTYHGD